jgi:hypothetical protein
LREYIDRLRTEKPNNRKLRERIMGNNVCNNELTAPLLALNWTRSGYKGKLETAVTRVCNDYQPDQHQQHDDLMNNDGYDADVGEGEEEMEEIVLLTSTGQSSNQSSNQPSNQPSDQSSNQPSGGQLSDDEYLEMDD